MTIENLWQGSLVSGGLQDVAPNAICDGIPRVWPEHGITLECHLQTKVRIVTGQDILHWLLENQIRNNLLLKRLSQLSQRVRCRARATTREYYIMVHNGRSEDLGVRVDTSLSRDLDKILDEQSGPIFALLELSEGHTTLIKRAYHVGGRRECANHHLRGPDKS